MVNEETVNGLSSSTERLEIDSVSTISPSKSKKATKREDYLSWDDYFMSVAFLSAQRSKDPNRQVGACIVDAENKIVGIGYNGMPKGCNDDDFPWGKQGPWLDQKYPYVCHAELNAIVNKNSSSIKNCRLYVSLFPCNDCTKLIIQSGIKEVIYASDVYHDQQQMIASRKMLKSASVETRMFQTSRSKVVLDFSSMKN